jgi:LPXTG-site transpeptidase (sortase) family protein
MRDFSLLAISLTSLVLGAFFLIQAGQPAEFVRLAEVEEDVEPFPDEPFVLSDLLVPTPQPQPPPASDAPITRLQIPSIGVDAPIVYLGVDAQGYMEAPKEPLDVGWYDFSAHPSFSGNAVFSGHVDSARIGPAIFWRLRQVSEGDEVHVSLGDGTTYAYRVVSSRTFTSNDAPVEEIIGFTERDSLTLITCDGTFNVRTHEYDKRLIVRAEKVLPEVIAQ